MCLYHSAHTLTKTTLGQKATANTSTPSSVGTKSRKTTGGARHKGAPRPRPSLLFCAEEWRGPGAAAVGYTGHLRRPLSPENKVWSCERAGCRGWWGWGCGAVHTKPKAHFARSRWSWLPIHPADQQQGWEGVLKWRRKPLKLTRVTSVTAQRSPRGGPYGRSHIICPAIAQRNSATANSSASVHPALPSDNTAPLSDWLRRCWH